VVVSVGKDGSPSPVVVDINELLGTIHGYLGVVYLLIDIVVFSVEITKLATLMIGDWGGGEGHTVGSGLLGFWFTEW
jgi:hypothetical protein